MWNGLVLTALAAVWSTATAHTVITYPLWRGDNLVTTGQHPQDNPDTIGVDYNNGTFEFPYGQQWTYPCGGMPMSQNRSYWPISGGAVAVQPGWFSGHSSALFYINVGITELGQAAPPNYSHPVVPPFQVVGPTNQMYDGTFCLPQVPLPANISWTEGQNVTIQVIETAQHGAAIYNCADVTLTNDMSLVPYVNATNCFNSSDLSFQLVFTTSSLSAAPSSLSPTTVMLSLPALAILAVSFLW